MNATWHRVAEGGLLLRFPGNISDSAHLLVRGAFEALMDWDHPGLRNLHPAYSSLLIEFDPLQVSFTDFSHLVKERLAAAVSSFGKPRLIEIPVYYDGEDLEEVAKLRGLTPEVVVHLHSSADYTVHFLGFQPGFPYLAGLPPELETPRLATPRLRVPAGSVAIAGKQAGIYSQASAGGWRLLGRTSLPLFRPEKRPLTLLRMGDRVKFRPVSWEAAGNA